MAKVFLNENESYSIINNSEVFGNIGAEALFISGSNVKVMSTVERIEFPNDLSQYSFAITGNVLTVKAGAATIATIVVPDTANGQTLAFADGSAQLVITGLNQATLGGIAIGTVVGSVDAPLNEGDISGAAAGNIFTLTDIVTSETTADIVTTIDPHIDYLTYWGYNPHAHGETGVDNLDGNNPDGNDNNLTNEGPLDGGVPLAALVDALSLYLGYQEDILNLFNTVDTLNSIKDITIEGAADQLQGGGFLGEDGALAEGFTLDGNNAVIDIEGNVVAYFNPNTGDYSGNYDITLTLSDGSTTNAQIQLSQQQFDFVNGLLFDAEGNTRLYEVERKTWPQVELKDQNGDVVKDADDNAILVNLYEYTAKGITSKTYYPIVLTPTKNNGGTIETGFTNDGNDTIVAGRLELLHQAYIDGGAGYNTLEIDAKGVYAQPTALLNIQEVHVQNMANVYTDGYNWDDTTYPDLAIDLNGNFDGNVERNSFIDLTRAIDLERLVVTEGGDYESYSGYLDVSDLTIVGIRNGAVARFEGGFSHDVTLHYGEGMSSTEPLKVELVIGKITANLNFLHNVDALELVSLGGSANSFGNEDIEGSQSYLGGRLTNLIISGNAALYINGDLDDSFQDETPITIDASANTGGVDLTLSDSEKVTFIGSQGNDTFRVETEDADQFISGNGDFDNDTAVTIIGGAGDNRYEVDAYTVTITNGDGNNNYEVTGDNSTYEGSAMSVSIVAGNGNNHLELESINTNVTLGNGNNHIEIGAGDEDPDDTTNPNYSNDVDKAATIKVGNGANVMDICLGDEIYGTKIDVTAGNGSNTIKAEAATIVIKTGSGADAISVLGANIDITTTGGADTITVVGLNDDFTNASQTNDGYDDGAVLKIKTGTGATDSATINLGDSAYYDLDHDYFPYQDGEDTITAYEGSVISGNNITLVVNTFADLRAANLTNATISRVILDDDNYTSSDASQANDADAVANNAMLTLTAKQFTTIGAAKFNVDGAIFNTHAFVKIIVDMEAAGSDGKISLTELGVDNLSRNIDLFLEVQDGVTLSMTAAQLHTRVAQNGVTLANDGNTDYANGKVVITGGGLNFDPFNTSDTVATIIAGTEYFGGSLSSDFGSHADGWFNVTVKSVYGGYDRPADAEVEIFFTIDSDVLAGETVGSFSTWHHNLEIIGDADVNFDGTIELGLVQGVPTHDFTVDFSALAGDANGLTLGNFEMVEAIYGNGDSNHDVRIDVEVGGDVASAEQGLVSSGVQTYVVTEIEGQGAKVGAFLAAYNNDGDGVSNAQYDADLVSAYYAMLEQYPELFAEPTGGNPTSQANWIEDNFDSIQAIIDDEFPNMADFFVCSTTQDLEVLGLQGNYDNTINFINVERGVTFLMEADYNKYDGYAVGTLTGDFARAGAAAVVDIVNTSGDLPAGEQIVVAGIEMIDAKSVTINVDNGDATIEDLAGDSLKTLDINSGDDVNVESDLPTSLTTIDAAGVAGNLSVTVDLWEANDTPLTFIGAAGSTTLTIDDAADDAIASISGAGPITLVIGDGVGTDSADLSGTDLTNITKVVLTDGSTLTISMEDADIIGADFFTIADGDTASLNLVGLSDQQFALANYDSDIDVTITIAALPVVTLHVDTDLTGIDGLEIPEGTVLNISAEQLVQLALDGGSISGDGTLNVYDASDADLALVLAGIADGDVYSLTIDGSVTQGTFELDGDLTIPASLSLSTIGSFDFLINEFTLTLPEIQLADGLSIVGTAGSILKFTDMSASAFESIDASGFIVAELMILNLLVANRNVDLMFYGLQESVTKVIYNGLGWVDGVTQNVIIEEGITVEGFVVFNKPESDVEIRDFNLTMNGGTEITGNLRLSASDNQDDLQQMDLQSVTINSLATADNPLTEIIEGANDYTGKTANIIGGDITSQGTGGQGSYISVDNDLLTVNINAEEDFTLEGNIVFESVTGNDGVTANDDDSATATLNVDTDAGVTVSLGDLEMDDDDVDFLVVNHTGEGTLSFELDGDHISDDDSVTINGSADGTTIIRISDEINLSDDTLNDIAEIQLEEDANLIMTFTQFNELGGLLTTVDTNNNPLDDGGQISIIGLGNLDVFDATLLPEGVTVGFIQVDPGTVTIAAGSDLTGVGELRIPEGSTLNISAALYAQLLGSGTITIVDDPDATLDTTLNIIGLTQTIVDEDGFDITGIDAGIDVTVTLSGTRVNLGTYDEDGNLTYTANLDSAGFPNPPDATFILADDQTLGLVNNSQADFLVVESFNPDGTPSDNTTLVWMFDTVPGGAFAVINASNYDVTTLKTLNVLVNGTNIESMISELPSDVTLQIYHNPEDLGLLNPTYRVVVVEESVTVEGSLMFNDPDSDDEVLTLNLTMLGGAIIDGDLLLSTTDSKDAPPLYFQSLIINSENENGAENYLQALGGNTGVTANIITGDIDADWDGGLGGVPPFPKEENNLLNITINATEELEIQGRVALDSVEDDADAFLTVSNTSTADVTIGQIDILDEEVASLTVANFGDGTLTITGGSPAIIADAGESFETLTFLGDGDIVIGDNDLGSSETGIDAHELSVINAAAMTGDLDLGEIEDIDSDSFTFTAGTGKTILTLTDDNLDSTGADSIPGNADDGDGWNFNFTTAAAGSVFHFSPDWVPADFIDGSILNIELGNNTTLFIDETMDLSGLDLDINFGALNTHPIYLADGVTLTLTAAQANGLTIELAPGATAANINIVDLGDAPVDLSGIDLASGITGWALLEVPDGDVTLDPATDLGDFGIKLIANSPANFILSGQTIRFQTVEQAEREIAIIDAGGDFWNDPAGDDGDYVNSTNVVWYFTSIAAPEGVHTEDYSPYIGRLIFSEELVNNEGSIESLFTTLPLTILRVDFADVVELDSILTSIDVNRVMEFASFSSVGDLTFSDGVAPTPEEHIQNLRLALGGQVTIGSIEIDDIVAPPAPGEVFDATSVEFEQLSINSRVALHDEHFLATEAYVNDNDGVDESYAPGQNEHVMPDAVNTIGDISVGGGSAYIDLMDVQVNTYNAAFYGVGGVADSSAGAYNQANADGADLVAGTLTFDYDFRTGDVAADAVALLDVNGVNDVTFDALDSSDADVTGVTINLLGHTGVFSSTGASPAFVGGDDTGDGNTEVLTFLGGAGSTAYLGYDQSDDVDPDPLITTPGYVINANAGIDASTLSQISTYGHAGEVHLGTVVDIDSEEFRISNDNAGGASDGVGANGDGVGTVTLTLGEALDAGGVLDSPVLSTTGRWEFDNGTGATGTMELTLDKVTFNAGGQLELDGVDVIVTGDIDLTPLAVADLSIQGGSINVNAGGTLRLTVAQVLALQFVGYPITGSGTIEVVGDATDDTFGTYLNTVNVDLTAVTIIIDPLALDPDNDLYVDVMLNGAIDDAGDPAGQHVIGSPFNDIIDTMASGDDIFEGRAGDDILYGEGGNDTLIGGAGDDDLVDSFDDTTFIVDANTDAAFGNINNVNTGDIVQVTAATATANVTAAAAFVATAATSNLGTAIFTAGDAANTTIDLTLASGPNGYTIIGNTSASLYADTLRGSAFADRINGGNSQQTLAGAVDTLTGNGGADIFEFNMLLNAAATLTPATTTPALDQEIINITADNAPDGVDESLTVTYSINGVSNPVLVPLGGIDVTSASAIATEVARILDGQAGIGAVPNGTNVVMTGDNGGSLTITSVVPGGTFTSLAGVVSLLDVDVPQVSTLTVSGTPTTDDVYSVLTNLVAGGGISSDYTALITDITAAQIATGLDGNYIDGAISAAVVGAVITFTDTNADDGGFILTTDTTAAFAGSGASVNGATDITTADIITDFLVGGADKIDLNLTAGTGVNYVEAAQLATFALARTAADTAFNGIVQYYLTSIPDHTVTAGTDPTGLLFFDANLDGNVDGVIALIGISAANFAATDIIA